jgi:peptidyl-prolyl cis-trans isomerase D
MFDLFRSRDKAVRILLGALLVVVGLSMLTYLIPSYNTGTGSSNDQVVAKIGGEEVTTSYIQQLIQATMRGRQLPPEIIPNYIPEIVNNVVTDRALAYEAQRMGLQVTDDQLRQAIQQTLPNLFPDGKFVGKDAYAALLAQQNITIPDFEADLKRQLLITRLRDIALEGTIVTQPEIEAAYRKKNEQAKIEFVKLSPDKLKSEIQVTPEELQNYFKANSSQYTIPEKRNLVMLVADQNQVLAGLNPTEDQLRTMYSQNQAQFRIPETVKVRHILLKTQGKDPSEDAKIKAQAEDILKQVKAGANFNDLVKKYSEDTASVPTGGVYSVQRNGQMVPEFENAAFSLKPGESAVVKTTYGYHIMQVMQHDPARIKPFEEAKADLAAEWKKQRASDVMGQISDKVQAALQKDPTNPDKVAAQFHMQVIKADGVEAGKPVPGVGSNPDFDQSISGLKKGEVSPAVALAGDKLVVAEVTDVIPARPATLDEVKDQVREAIVRNRLAVLVQTRAKELVDKAKSMGGDLAKAAKSMGLEVKTSDDFTRAGSVKDLGSAAYVQEAFARPDGSIIGPIATPDGTVVAKVLAHVQPDMAKLPAQRAEIRDEIKSQRARDRNAMFEAGVRDQLIRQGKIKIYQDVVNRLITNYRTS